MSSSRTNEIILTVVMVILLMSITLLFYHYTSIGGSIAFVVILTLGALAPMTA